MSKKDQITRPGHRSALPHAPWEEEGTLWLWAWPEMAAWPRDVCWLFSPVVGRRPYPGDLVGVDEDGRLLVIEAKRASRPEDPFEDLVGTLDYFQSLPTKKLQARWEKLLEAERRFISQFGSSVPPGPDFDDLWPGVAPYSSKRFATARWWELYRTRIAPLILNDPGYEERVISFLARRDATADRPVSFGALFTVPEGQRPRLSPDGKRNWSLLVEEVGTENVWARAVQARVNAERVELVGWTPATGLLVS